MFEPMQLGLAMNDIVMLPMKAMHESVGYIPYKIGLRKMFNFNWLENSQSVFVLFIKMAFFFCYCYT